MTCTILRVEPPTLSRAHPHRRPLHNAWELEPVETAACCGLSHSLTDIAGAIDSCYVVGLQPRSARLAPARWSSGRVGLGRLR